jgi:DNA-binding transcriptional LysR family regulator
VSTSRVSQIIRKLERRVGAPLFRRTSRRVELTAIGRELHRDVGPAWRQIGAGLQRAVDAGRGVTGTLRVGFVGAAGGQFLAQAAELFGSRHPGCDVQIREAQVAEVMPWVRDGVVDLAFTGYPTGAPDLAHGGVLIREARMLAVPAHHPLARRGSVSIDDLASMRIVQLPGTPPAPDDTPAGRIGDGPVAATFQEMLTLVGSGRGAFPVGAHVRRYYPRPDVAYVGLTDAPPVEWGLVWRADAATARVLAFHEAARDLVHREPEG